MTFPSLPGQHNYQNRCKLERAADELEYYRAKVAGYDWRVRELKTEIENATPETAAELFSKAWHLCREMEKILQK